MTHDIDNESMSGTPRDTDPSEYRLITIRTDEARLWMIPSRNVEKILGGILARYQELLSIQIFAYCFLSNHYHLLIRAPLQNTDEFEENVNREIARRINWKNHRQGKFWGRRYGDQRVVDIKSGTIENDDLLETFLYITTNAVRHGMVTHPIEWPGLSCYKQLLDEKPKSYSFYHYSARDEQSHVTRHSIVLTPLEKFDSLSKLERRTMIKRLVRERCDSIAKARHEAGAGFLGADAISSQVPGSLPKDTSRSRRPYCYTKNYEARTAFKIAERERRSRYRECSIRYRLGDLHIQFPEFTFKPPLNRTPRSAAFSLHKSEDFLNVA